MTSLGSIAGKAGRTLRDEGFGSLVRKVARKVGGTPVQEEPRQVDVLFVNGCYHDVPHPARYRISHQMEQLEELGITCDQLYYYDLTPADEERASVIVLFRTPLIDKVSHLVSAAHAHGKKVFFDVDDLVINVSYTNELPFVRVMSPEDKAVFDDGVTRTGEALALCDGAVVSTERLAEEVGKVVPHVLVNRNVASREMVDISEKARQAETCRQGDDVILGYLSGSLTHDSDFALVSEAIAEVMRQRPGVRLAITGLGDLPEQLKPYEDRVIRHDYVDWRELPSLIAKTDICLAPLEDTVFNQAKSENRWVDASLVGIPTVASDAGAFARMIRQNETGILCRTSQEWERALLGLVDDADLRGRIGDRARAFCLAHCTTAGTGYRLARVLLGRRCTIDGLLPREDCARATLVDDYLSSCGMTVPTASFDRTPWDRMTLEDRVDAFLRAHEQGKRCALMLYEMTSGDTPTFRYLGYNVCQALGGSSVWHAGFFYVSELPGLDRVIDAADLAILIRMRIRPDVVALVDRLHRSGVPVAYDMDDDALGSGAAPRIIEAMHISDDDDFGHDFWYGVCDRFERAASLCDGFVSPVGYLADVFSGRYGKRAYVIDNSLNDEQLAVSRAVEKAADDHRLGIHPFTVAYFSGTDSHSADFALAEDAVVGLLEAHDDARLLLVGCLELSDRIDYLYQEGRVILLPLVDYVTLQCLQASADVVLAPVIVDAFTNCKSALKAFEAGAVGTPACASPSFSFKDAIDDGTSGFVCDDAARWSAALESLYADRERCQGMGRAARAVAVERYHGGAIRSEAEHAFDALMGAGIGRHDPYEDELLGRLTSEGVDWDDQLSANPPYGKRVRHGA